MTWQEEVELAQTNTQKWVCEGCGKEEVATAQEAYSRGWDVPPWFSVHVKCNKCPITKTFAWVVAQGYEGETE